MDNRLKEAIVRDPELGEAAWNEYVSKAQRNPVFKTALKEGLYSDVAGALGGMHDIIWASAQPATIGRELLTVIPTKDALVRFPKDLRAYAFTGEGPKFDTGGRMETQDIKCDIEMNLKKEWTESYAEDASWNVLAWQSADLGRAIARLETEKIVAAFNAIAAGNLANGSESTIASPITWANICDNLGYVENQDFHPDIVAVSATVFAELMRLAEFISSLYNDRQNFRIGVVEHTSLGVRFVRSSLVTKSLFIDSKVVGALPLRRDVQTRPYENPAKNTYGVAASERIGIGILRTKAVQRGSR